jgi:hypothetical protein
VARDEVGAFFKFVERGLPASLRFQLWRGVAQFQRREVGQFFVLRAAAGGGDIEFKTDAADEEFAALFAVVDDQVEGSDVVGGFHRRVESPFAGFGFPFVRTGAEGERVPAFFQRDGFGFVPGERVGGAERHAD